MVRFSQRVEFCSIDCVIAVILCSVWTEYVWALSVKCMFKSLSSIPTVGTLKDQLIGHLTIEIRKALIKVLWLRIFL